VLIPKKDKVKEVRISGLLVCWMLRWRLSQRCWQTDWGIFL